MTYSIAPYGGGHYGSYPMYGGGYGYQFAPVQSPPTTPFEQQRAEMYQYRERTNGMLVGGAGGALAGAGTGALIGFKLGTIVPVVGNVVGAVAGGIIGGIVGGLLGGSGGREVGGMIATNRDARDNGKLDGSPLFGYTGVF